MKRDDLYPTRYEHLSSDESDLYDFAKPFAASDDPVVKTLADGVISLLEKKVNLSKMLFNQSRY